MWAGVTAAFVLLSMAVVNTHVRGDGNGYYAWLASAVIDHDADFRNQYRHANALFSERYLTPDGAVVPARVTVTGHVENQWAVGPAVLWAPWFLAAHAVVLVRGDDPEDGYAPLYRRVCAIGSLVYAFGALWLSVATARRFGASSATAWSGAVSVFGASSLLVYTYLLPFHVHALAAFTVALFLWYGLGRQRPITLVQWCIWGALAGLMVMTYHLDAVFVLAALPAALSLRVSGARAAVAVRLAGFMAMAVAVGIPQWVGKAVVYGSPFVTGYRDRFFWSAPELWRTAFSSNHGVILWTPIVAVGIAGWCGWLRHRTELWGLALAGAVFYLAVASYENWHGLSSFGNRFFVSWTFPLVIGVSDVVTVVWRRGAVWRAVLVTGLCGLMLWNAALAFQWASKMVPSRGDVQISAVVTQQWSVPRRVVDYARRYWTDRDALIREIEGQDQREWETYRKNQ